MAQYENHSTHTNVPREPVREGSGTGTMAFIIGGLVVAVAVIAWFLSGGDMDNSVTTVPAEGGDAAVTIENTAPATDGGAAMEEAAPVDDGAATPAPAEEAAPADGGAAAPVEEPAN
ncbi:hypothetical protein [Vannielia litorea]|uniref:Uncharacterized protein n=1 Tax=Vannielia litorea TaxID=1217970 RepID=A0A1N6EPZ5_9RHOB|nr:hypothetical protein [Vannielia litorea]SIN85074.1 hypothetical protein SAMN05444002_0996 [Vannielia litorea]